VDPHSRDRGRMPLKTDRIAVVGAGPGGLTAAHALTKLGYEHVTVYEKEDQPGGKVLTDYALDVPLELGAVFATDAYAVTLQLARELGAEVLPMRPKTLTLDDDGTLSTGAELAIRRHGSSALAAALSRYETLSGASRVNDLRGFAGFAAELDMPFADYVDKYDLHPIADMVRAPAVGYGYPYFDDVPAMYYFALLDLMMRVRSGTPVFATHFGFPAGYQSLWARLAKDLDVRCSSEVTAIDRSSVRNAPRIEVEANGEHEVYEHIVIATPPAATMTCLDLTPEERELFAQVVSRRYHVTVATVSGVRPERRSIMPYAHTRPEAIGHVNIWLDPIPAEDIFVAYQNVSWSQKDDETERVLAEDFATLGGGTIDSILSHKAWTYFAHVETDALADGFYDRFEAMQGGNGTLFLGAPLAFESVEHTARYARGLITEFFAS
jgi:oxygen-dependent protoporphyrinogen oxidase